MVDDTATIKRNKKRTSPTDPPPEKAKRAKKGPSETIALKSGQTYKNARYYLEVECGGDIHKAEPQFIMNNKGQVHLCNVKIVPGRGHLPRVCWVQVDKKK